ncbi:LLM class flavin-dependent oxidoreductase [Saccharopolyspora hirsuta]|uniref:LLM class flavin-dependent oxidoreductase n=1 Tax=Saccharopolyspora hirsuta TaxID=1837 RepID=UPI0033184953
MTDSVALSLLELAPVERGASEAASVAAAREVARWADGAGLHRFWVAEHHNTGNIASSAPAVLLSAIGAATERIRLGSGGVMLPNHPPLVVAESFGTLAALFPGRVDLGVGRAPGTDPATAEALRRVPADRFDSEVDDLLGFLSGTFPSGHRYEHIRAVPEPTRPPQLWMLGSSVQSAQLAALLGLPYAFAHHFFGARGAAAALSAYRKEFRPSPALSSPYAMITVHVVCGEDDEHARWLAAPAVMSALGVGGGARTDPFAGPKEAAAQEWTDDERQRAEQLFAAQAIGGSEKVAGRLDELLAETGADELMLTNNVTDVDERIRSYARVLEIFAKR